jgi:hypothetical protein
MAEGLSEAELPHLHIYGQGYWHDDVWLQGSRAGLKALRDAIDRCLAESASARSLAITADGEGYNVVIDVRSLEALDRQPLPYIDPIAGGPPDWTGVHVDGRAALRSPAHEGER